MHGVRKQPVAHQDRIAEEGVDHYRRRVAWGTVLAQGVLAQAVEGAGDNLVEIDPFEPSAVCGRQAGVREQLLDELVAPAEDARSQLGRGFDREGGGQDGAGRDLVAGDELEDAQRQDRRLAGAGAGDQVGRGVGGGRDAGFLICVRPRARAPA